MNIHIICVGKLKETYFVDACKEYMKRLSRFSKLKITELPDEPIPERASAREEEAVLEKEGQKILSHLSRQDTVITLCVVGKQMSSEKLAAYISDCALSGKSDLAFIIGGSLGLSDEVKKSAALRLSFSEMTFPHQLMRVVLLEQIYRAFKINANEAYHK
ncbi:MAG: 23S rRNA (pseudouridine(1915)-N(3))-methyltransferase RlmH [Clostridia bacterium]|nr:23S rRNA (pseudouridine(1915)-N(3))-methyltransferase RlmH [Clostridia bacterium]